VSENFNAPLGSFSARSVAAYSLGLISEKDSECDRLRKVRNEFAHSVHKTFDDQKIKDICANLAFAAKGPPNAPVNPKGQYTTAASSAHPCTHESAALRCTAPIDVRELEDMSSGAGRRLDPPQNNRNAV
jgi:hypothetical protein